MYQGDKAETLKIRMKDYLKGFRNPKVFIREKRSINDPFYKADKTFNIATTGDYQVPDDLRPLADFFHDKTRYNALYEPKIKTFLKSYRHIGLMGLETHTSIMFTAEELVSTGYDVTVIEPCTLSRDDYLHGYAISIMSHYLGVRITDE